MDSVANKTPDVVGLIARMRELPQVECPLVHRFTPGLYVREMTAPANSLLVSRIHRTEHPFVLSKGKIAVWTEESGVQVLTAPHCGVSKAGGIRMAVVLEDVVWTTFHATNTTDLGLLEEELSSEPVPAKEQLCLSLQ